MDADTSALTDLHPPVQPITRHRKVVFVFPVGSEFSGEIALFLCRVGAAEPSDDECRAELGWNAEQIARQQLKYKMDDLGINSPEDRELYKAGVILGYDAKLEYIPGPNWAAYQAAKSETEKEEL
jgi:hypothetical protein